MFPSKLQRKGHRVGTTAYGYGKDILFLQQHYKSGLCGWLHTLWDGGDSCEVCTWNISNFASAWRENRHMECGPRTWFASGIFEFPLCEKD